MRSILIVISLLLGGCLQTAPVRETYSAIESDQSETRYIKPDYSPQPYTDQAHEIHYPNTTEAISEFDNIWERIRQSDRLGNTSREAVQTELDFYRDKQRFFNIITENAKPFIYHIVEEIERRDMPLHLALIPIIESGYRADATSAWKAAGLWQFIPSTGEHFGLKQNDWYDGRRDLTASTNAALDYFQKLYDRFGNWPLALAAYNSGEATVARAIAKNEEAGKPTDFWSLDLPPDTRSYIPKFIALETIIAEPHKYGIDLTPIPDSPAVTTVDTQGPIALEKVAELANIETDKLKKLNAAYLKSTTEPEGTHELLVPLEVADRLKYRLSTLPEEERIKNHNHTVQPGETLGGIANKYQVRVSSLKELNKLESDSIRSGIILQIPVPASAQAVASSTSETTSETNKLHKDQIYRVRGGDSLWLIARRFDIHVKEILEWNNMKQEHPLKPGQELKIISRKPILEAAAL